MSISKKYHPKHDFVFAIQNDYSFNSLFVKKISIFAYQANRLLLLKR